jgi:hypothetical protein
MWRAGFLSVVASTVWYEGSCFRMTLPTMMTHGHTQIKFNRLTYKLPDIIYVVRYNDGIMDAFKVLSQNL